MKGIAVLSLTKHSDGKAIGKSQYETLNSMHGLSIKFQRVLMGKAYFLNHLIKHDML